MNRIAIILICLSLSACASPQPAIQTAIAQTQLALPTPTFTPTPTNTPVPNLFCPQAKVKDLSAQLQDIFERWNDADKIASSTGRGSLSGPVANLQQIKRDENKIEVPLCLEVVKTHLYNAMNYTIDGYLAFMSQGTDSEVKFHFDAATREFQNFSDEMQRIKSCAPDCPQFTPTP